MNNLKTAQLALVESEERYRMITEWAHDVIWSLNTQGDFVFLSPSIEILTGIKPQELIHKSPSAILTDSSFSLLDSTLKNIALQVQTPLFSQPNQIELEYVHSNGKVIVTEVTLSFLLNRDGSFDGFVAITRDITARKKIELELLEAKKVAESANLSLLSANAILHGHATTDQLTGVANRRHFENCLESQMGTSKNQQDT